MRSSLVTLVLGLLFASTARSEFQKPLETPVEIDKPRWGNPIPTCGSCVPRERIVAPGVGFDLTASYGTAAIRFYNQTVVDVGRIEGSKEYKSLMNRLSAPYRRQGPPFSNRWEELKWRASLALRKARQLRGLPSTVDIELLSNFLKQLRLAATNKLNAPVCEVATALPYLPSLTPDDLAEAFTFAGLKTLQSYKHPYGPLNELNAAYAGMGYGLCTHWGNITACEAEEDALPEKLALMISFTHAELRINSALVYNAHTGYLLASGRWPDLGYEKWLKNEQNSTFWNEVGGRVVLMTKGYTGGRKIEVLLLTGEDTQQKRFLDAVWKALDQPNVFAELQKPGFDEEFVVARGAAELAKRWVGETWDCVEGPWCERNRDLGDDN